ARRPLYTAIERAPVPDIDPGDERLLRAFRQRYDRLAAASARLSLERLCEQIVSEHDYDLAVLARPDGKRRYANLRKLMRLARSYEELRGPDVEGFVRFVREQEALGARGLEAVAGEEERAERLRLYYVAMTRAKERLIVSGAVDPAGTAERETPIGWVLRRLEAQEEVVRAGNEPVELTRGEARLLVRVDRFAPAAE